MAGIFLVIVIGLILGSFATALSWRVPRGMSWIFGQGYHNAARSRCPSCNAVLSIADLIPLFSWLFLKGRCRHCGTAISWWYPLTELLTLAGVAGVYAVFGFSMQGMVVMAMVPFLVALLMIDARHMILPDQLTLIYGVIGLFFLWFSGERDDGWAVWAWHGLAAVLYAGLLWAIGYITKITLRREALGLGDVKFMAVAGFWLGVPYLSVFFIISGVLGILWGVVWRALKRGPVFPFGPALILSFYACLLMQRAGFSGFFMLF